MKKTIILGVTGGIAAYKSAWLASNLTKKDYDVHVIMTKNATEFVQPLTFETLTRNPVTVNTFDRNDKHDVNHISLAKRADLFIVCPASANSIAKFATGLADDMLSTTFLAANCPKLIAPAMNTEMLENAITERNIQICESLGIEFVESSNGYLACGDLGRGRLAEIHDIEDMVEKLLFTDKPLTGKNVLITAGPTEELLDPVRFITNHSSGKMGYSLARAARNLGAEVMLISGPTNEQIPAGINVIHVRTALEMFEAVKSLADSYDILVKAAAVSDYRAKEVAPHKMKKNNRRTINLEFEVNPDILAYMGSIKRADQILCGFAMETEDLIENARKKMEQKQLDMIVANHLNDPEAGFKVDTNKVTLITPNETLEFNSMSKNELAYSIMNHLIDISKNKGKVEHKVIKSPQPPPERPRERPRERLSAPVQSSPLSRNAWFQISNNIEDRLQTFDKSRLQALDKDRGQTFDEELQALDKARKVLEEERMQTLDKARQAFEEERMQTLDEARMPVRGEDRLQTYDENEMLDDEQNSVHWGFKTYR